MYKPQYERDYVIAENKRKLIADIIKNAELALVDAEPNTKEKFLNWLRDLDSIEKSKSSLAFNHLLYL